MRPVAGFAWGLLAYDVAVVAWGAYVRATGSGAGCGRHWPTCNGDFVPRVARLETLVEFSHRASSAAAFILTIVLLVWTLRAFPRGHRVRRGAAAACALMATEALIGAGLVLFALVAHDASLKRALSIALHLVNTFFLLAATALTAWWASGGAPLELRGRRTLLAGVGLPLVAMVFVGASGAVTALGDTLFPAASLAEGLARDLAPSAHLFVRLRAIHPILAVGTATATIGVASVVRNLRPTGEVSALSRITTALASVQVAAGLLDVLLRAPVLVQVVHLVLADAVWIALILTAAAALAKEDGGPAVSPPRIRSATHTSRTPSRGRAAAESA
jgi:heme A synthase